MRSSGVIKVLYVVRKASQYKTRSAEQKQRRKWGCFGAVFTAKPAFRGNGWKHKDTAWTVEKTLNKKQTAGKTKRLQDSKRWLGSCSMATLSLRWQVQGGGLLTVPLRSVSVAWTNRMSPDPARTSGPSSFWGGGGNQKREGRNECQVSEVATENQKWGPDVEAGVTQKKKVKPGCD